MSLITVILLLLWLPLFFAFNSFKNKRILLTMTENSNQPTHITNKYKANLRKTAQFTYALLPLLFSNKAKADSLSSQQVSSHSVVDSNLNSDYIDVPLDLIDDVYCLNYTLYNIDNNITQYRAIVDTGSPFLIVPNICTRLWGCGKRILQFITC